MTSTISPPDAERSPDGTGSRQRERTIRPRRGLPSGRAVLGGLLVAVAAVGIFMVVSGTGDAPSTRYVVATGPVQPGTVIRAEDLGTVALDLPASVAGRSFTDAGTLIDTVALAPLAEGEIVQQSSVGEATRDGVPAVALQLSVADAYDGRLRPGDRVDAIASFGSGVGASSRLIVADAVVARSPGRGDDPAVSDAGQITVTLSVPDPTDRLELIAANKAGAVTLTRTTGTGGGGDEEVHVIRPVRAGEATDDGETERGETDGGEDGMGG